MKTPLVPISPTSKRPILNKVAAIVCLISGLMIVLTCGQVLLLGKVPEQYVVKWLPPFQFLIGMFSIFITTILLWKDHFLAISAVIFTLSLQVLAMVTLVTVYADLVTAKTLNTLSLRVLLTVAVLVLILLHKRKMRHMR